MLPTTEPSNVFLGPDEGFTVWSEFFSFDVLVQEDRQFPHMRKLKKEVRMWFVLGHIAVRDKAGNNIQTTSPRFQLFLRPEFLNTKQFPVDCCPVHKLGCFAVSKDA